MYMVNLNRHTNASELADSMGDYSANLLRIRLWGFTLTASDCNE